ncbi:MAG: hypothetical protein K0Q54_2610 [Methylobacterium brachiatum]|nr:hypothetical protein [Methylobacterium brachiatum]
MPSEVATKALEFLSGSPKNIFLFVGVSIIVLAIFGGINYQDWAPLHELNDRLALGTAGVIFLFCGLAVYAYENTSNKDTLNPDKYDIKITHPDGDQKGHHFNVKGTFAKKIPDNYKIVVVRTYDNGSYIPIGEAKIIKKEKTWMATNCDIAGEIGKKRKIVVYLVGPSGQAFLDYHNDIQSFHSVNRKIAEERGVDLPFIPGIQRKTKDMLYCDEVMVERI